MTTTHPDLVSAVAWCTHRDGTTHYLHRHVSREYLDEDETTATRIVATALHDRTGCITARRVERGLYVDDQAPLDARRIGCPHHA